MAEPTNKKGGEQHYKRVTPKTKGTCHSKALQPSSRSAMLMLNQ